VVIVFVVIAQMDEQILERRSCGQSRRFSPGRRLLGARTLQADRGRLGGRCQHDGQIQRVANFGEQGQSIPSRSAVQQVALKLRNPCRIAADPQRELRLREMACDARAPELLAQISEDVRPHAEFRFSLP